MKPLAFCPDHHPVVIFVTHTGWWVLECPTCHEGDVVLPPGQMCFCPECKGEKRGHEEARS
jgi:hypothetical protein